MANRDKRGREKRKPKKSTSKPAPQTVKRTSISKPTSSVPQEPIAVQTPILP